MSNFNPFFNNPYSAFLRQQDEERRRREGLLPGATQQPDDDWAGRPVVKGRWPGKYPTLVEELPDSIADLPNWNEDDFRQLSPKILDAIFGSHATQISLLPTLLQIEKAEVRKRGDFNRRQQETWLSPNLPSMMIQSEEYEDYPNFASLTEEEIADQEEYERRKSKIPEPTKNPMEVIEWKNPTGKGVRIEDGQGRGTFGASRSRDGKEYSHQGQDYTAEPGQDIYAITNGTVVRLPSGSYDGIVVGNGRGISWKILYVDVSSSLSIGDFVSSGEVIGTAQDIRPNYGSGMTNHVHVKLRVDGIVVDPRDYIPD